MTGIDLPGGPVTYPLPLPEAAVIESTPWLLLERDRMELIRRDTMAIDGEI